MKVKLTLDLSTAAGAAAMRAWLDAVHGPAVGGGMAEPAFEFTSPVPDFGWRAPEPVTTFAFPHEGTIPEPQECPAPERARADATEDRGSGETGADAQPQDSLPANPEPQPEGVPDPEPSSATAEAPEETPAVVELVEAPAAPEPEEPYDDPADPERFITDLEKVRIWNLAVEGHTGAAIARMLVLAPSRVHNLLWRIRNKKCPVPTDPEAGSSTALAVVRPAAAALTVSGSRPPAVDPVIAEKRAVDLADRQVAGFVRRELYPTS